MAHEGLPVNRFAGIGWTEIPKRLQLPERE
jgi:hypothetical protein